MKRDLLYAATCLAFTIMIGGAVYEHLVLVPKWAAAPPVSLSMFQGTYALKTEIFWMLIHPVNLVLFISTLVVHWRSLRRKNLLIVVSVYLLILIITSIYFVPELISIITAPFSATADAGLTYRAGLWEILSLVRLGVLLILAMILFLGLTKSARKTAVVSRKSVRGVEEYV